tara:strand:- start:41 stop:361 length:321 start_codon:yes stop_codon:yes gene_type:complete
MKYVKISNGNVVLATVMPTSSWIDKAADRTFVGEGYIEVNESVLDDALLLHKYDSSAEEESIKTVASFTSPGVDDKGNKKWFVEDTGVLMQYTYNADNQITGQEEA